MQKIWCVVAAACAVALACSDGTGPGVLTTQLTFVEQSASAPPLAATQVSFWVKRGESQKGELFYETGDRFLEFRVNSGSLVRRPDGTTFAPGDSILITVTVDPLRFIAKFQPEGLEFHSDDPAELEVRYDKADSSFLDRERDIRAWRQERAGEPWRLVPSLQFEDLDELEIDVRGFTRYALAIG